MCIFMAVNLCYSVFMGSIAGESVRYKHESNTLGSKGGIMCSKTWLKCRQHPSPRRARRQAEPMLHGSASLSTTECQHSQGPFPTPPNKQLRFAPRLHNCS